MIEIKQITLKNWYEEPEIASAPPETEVLIPTGVGKTVLNEKAVHDFQVEWKTAFYESQTVNDN